MRLAILLTAAFGLCAWALPVEGMNILNVISQMLTDVIDAQIGIMRRHDNDEQVRYPDRDEDIRYPDDGLYAESG